MIPPQEKTMSKRKKEYWEMTTEELREATKEFDEDFAFEKGRPLTAADRKLFAKARKRGRPRIGLGSEKVRVTIERGLLKEADAYAKASHISRSELIARGLRAVIGKRRTA
jgi:hypothetical protein